MSAFAIVLGIVYLIVGGVKVAGVKRMADQFDEFGLKKPAVHVVGAIEVAAAVGLQTDSLRTWAALGMVVAMVGAIFFHQRAKHSPDQSVPAAVVLVASLAFFALSL